MHIRKQQVTHYMSCRNGQGQLDFLSLCDPDPAQSVSCLLIYLRDRTGIQPSSLEPELLAAHTPASEVPTLSVSFGD